MKLNPRDLFSANKKRTVLISSVIILCVGIIPTIILTFNADPEHPYTITQKTLTSEDGTNLQAVFYSPREISGDVPGIINTHGFCGNKHYNQLLSIELVKRGFMVVNIDYRGHGSSGGGLPSSSSEELTWDVMAAYKFLNATSHLDTNRVGLVGHSMGGRTSLLFAEKNLVNINATVSIGMVQTGLNFTNISNLLMVYGTNEQIFSKDMGLDFLRNYTGMEDVEIGILYGNFSGNGNTTKVARGPYSEHLLELFDTVILQETVEWFERSFYSGSVRWEINLTAPYFTAFFLVTLIGMLLLVFICIVYLGNLIWKNQDDREIADEIRGKPLWKPVLTYPVATLLSLILFITPFQDLFSNLIPITMFSSVYSQLAVGVALGVLLIIAIKILIHPGRKEGLKSFFSSFKARINRKPLKAILFGLLSALVSIIGLVGILDWTIATSVPTSRELGTIFAIAGLLFPCVLVKEYYLRGEIQDRVENLKFTKKSKVRQYLTMLGIGLLLDHMWFFVLMPIFWQSPDHDIAFIALSLTAATVFSCIRHVMSTWIYTFSRKNILGSTVFLCFYWAFNIILFYPFGLPRAI